MDQSSVLHDQLTSLILSPVGPAPAPVLGTDGSRHLAYELSILNPGPRPATISSLTTHANTAEGPVVAQMTAEQVVEHALLVGAFTVPPEPVSSIPSGGTVVVIMDAVLPVGTEPPAELVHRIEATFGELRPDQAEFARAFPTAGTEVGGRVGVDATPPVRIGPPLTGPNWFAANACGSMNAHRGAVVPVRGSLHPAERYAIDWVRIDPGARPLVDVTTGLIASFTGDAARNESYFTFDQPVLAVADGEIVAICDDLPEATPQVMTPGLAFDQLGGNYVILRIADGVHAFYAHLKLGSLTVALGDRVRTGQVLGRTGNSGNTSEAHLHFHLMSEPVPLSSANLPFVIDRFSYAGQFAPDGLVGEPDDREDQLPMVNSVISFPELPAT